MNEQDERLYQNLCVNNREKIYRCEDLSFRKYGAVRSLPFTEELTIWADGEIDPEGPVYLPHYPSSDDYPWKGELERDLYGGFPLQIGSCCGMNTAMNGMEYHKGHEFILALTPLVLFLGHSPQITEDEKKRWTWDSSKGKFYFVPVGTAVELYSTTMHLAPCRVDSSPFRSLIILPAETNLELDFDPGAGSLLFMKNKWMISHPDSPAARKGAYIGISGENREIRALEDQ